jgi:hypothetical protein
VHRPGKTTPRARPAEKRIPSRRVRCAGAAGRSPGSRTLAAEPESRILATLITKSQTAADRETHTARHRFRDPARGSEDGQQGFPSWRGPRGLRVRCSAFPHVHRRSQVQVTVLRVPPWTLLDVGELQLKLQLAAWAGIPPSPAPGVGVMHSTLVEASGFFGSHSSRAWRIRSRLRRAHATKTLNCTNSISALACGDRSGTAPSWLLARSVLTALGVVFDLGRARGRNHPRQASADDDAGKCSGGDRL